MDRTQYIVDRLPPGWDTVSTQSVVGAIVKGIANELATIDEQIEILDGMIGIDGSHGDDLDARWGAMLNVVRRVGEDDDKYRNRLKTSISNLSGGTADAIRYAVAVALNIDRYPIERDSRIQIIDAWKFTGDGGVTIPNTYGNVICYVDIEITEINATVLQNLSDAIQMSKAAGINVYVLWYKREYEEIVLSKVSTDAESVIQLHTIYMDDTTVNGEEHTIIGTEDTELPMATHEAISDEAYSFNRPPEEALSNKPQYTLSSTFYTNCKSGFDVIHTVGQPDQVI